MVPRYITGDRIKYLVGPTVHTKTYIYIAIITNNIWSHLLWSPVIVSIHSTHCRSESSQCDTV